MGLHDDWVERVHIDLEDDSDDGQTQTHWQSVDSITAGNDHPRSLSSGVSATSSSWPTTQLSSDDECEGGITDDAGEREEYRKLSGKARPAETLKSYYGGRSKASETGVCIGTNLNFAAHMSLNRSILWPALSPLHQFPAS